MPKYAMNSNAVTYIPKKNVRNASQDFIAAEDAQQTLIISTETLMTHTIWAVNYRENV